MITVVMEPCMKDKAKWTSSLGGKLAGKLWVDASGERGDDPAVAERKIRHMLLETMSEERRREAELYEQAREEIVREAARAEQLRRSSSVTSTDDDSFPGKKRNSMAGGTGIGAAITSVWAASTRWSSVAAGRTRG